MYRLPESECLIKIVQSSVKNIGKHPNWISSGVSILTVRVWWDIFYKKIMFEKIEEELLEYLEFLVVFDSL